MQVYFTNLGCKLNQAEVEKLSREFLAAGHTLAPSLEEAELHVVNSCTVTHLAARDSRKIARRGHRKNAALKTVLTGCYASATPEEAAAVAGVDLVVTNDRKDDLLDLVHDTFPDALPASVPELPTGDEPVPVPYVPLDFGRARGLVKVEDGCNMRCSFCIIPSTRGRQRSRTVESVVEEVRALVAGGYREIVVTGVQISEYDDDGRRLYDLVAAILGETDVPRLRLTSIAPWKFDRRLLDLWRDPRLCRHIHMSLQSGSTATLRRMRRPYSAEQYAELAGELRTAIPGLALTTDVIVGFPGETDAEFAESLAFVERMAFAKPHIFTYSSRAGTHAAGLDDHVDHAVKKERVRAMIEVGQGSEAAFYRDHLGATLDVVWEEQKGDRWSGTTDNYIRVFAEIPAGSAQELEGHILAARLVEVTSGGVMGRLAIPAPATTINRS